MSILFSDGDYYRFNRTSGATRYGKGALISDTDGTPNGPRHLYWAKDLALGADNVLFEDSPNPSGDPISVGWERSFGGSIPSSSTINDWIHDYYEDELDGQSWPGMNLHPTQIDPGSHSLDLNNTNIGQVDVYSYSYGGTVLTVEHWWLKSGVGSPVLQRSGNELETDYVGSTPGSATSPSAPTGFTYNELILVVVL